MTDQRKALLAMHLATFLFGFTAIFGKLIQLDQLTLVWHRMWMAAAVFLLMPAFWKGLRQMGTRTLGIFTANGVLVALHWLTFYGCIKMSNSASLALACFGTASTFTAVLEPLITRSRFRREEIGLGILVLFGLLLVARANPDNNLSLESTYIQAIGLGVLSAFLASLFSVINKKFVKQHSPVVTVWAQMLGGWLFLSLLIPLLFEQGDFQWIPEGNDLVFLLLLSILCTNVAFSMEMWALRQASAFQANLILNLEPIYGMGMAVLLFSEQQMLNAWFYAGALLIMASVFAHPLLLRRIRKASGTAGG